MLRGLSRFLAPKEARTNTTDFEECWTGTFDPKADKADIYYCFRLILGRRPNKEEWPGHSSRTGEDLASVVSSYVNSREFAIRKLIGRDYLEGIECCQKPGFQIYASRSDLAVGKAVLTGDYEWHVAAIFRRTLAAGSGVIDVGANIGYFSLLSASLVGPEGYVLAVEPNQNNVKLLEASRRLNGFEHLRVLLGAAGADLGLLALNTSHSNGVASALGSEVDDLMSAAVVPSIPVDSVVPHDRRIDLIKVDVEGGEYLALLGLRNTLERCRPTVVFEFSPRPLETVSGQKWTAIFDLLSGLDYRFAEILPSGQSPWTDDPQIILNYFVASEVDHIDVIAEVPR